MAQKGKDKRSNLNKTKSKGRKAEALLTDGG